MNLPDFSKMQIQLDENGDVNSCIIEGVEGKINRTGNRRVFIFADMGFVVKFDRSSDYYLGQVGEQNMREARNYKKLHPSDLKYFAKLLRVGRIKRKLYLVQEYCPSGGVATVEVKKEFDALKVKYWLSDMQLYIGDEEHHNVVVTPEGFKIFDLGWEKCIKTIYENPAQATLF